MKKIRSTLKGFLKTVFSIIIVLGLFITYLNNMYHNYKDGLSFLINERNYILDTYDINDFTLLDEQIETNYFEFNPDSDRKLSENATCISGRNIFRSENNSYLFSYNLTNAIVIVKYSGSSEFKELIEPKAIFEIKAFYTAATKFFDEASTEHITKEELQEIKSIIYNVDQSYYSNEFPLE